VAGASTPEDRSQDATPPPPPTPPAGSRPRTVSKTFRVSAVWRPPRPATEGQAEAQPPESAHPAGLPLSDEEVVYGLITQRKRFDAQAVAYARALHDGVVSVTLEEARPAASVAVQVAFLVQVRGNAVAVVAGLAEPVMRAAADALQAAYGQPVAVSAVLEPIAVAAAASTAPPKSGWDRVAPVLAAIGTGVGVIGFVTFIGGVTVYARLRAAGFPAAPALGIFPSQDLVVIGAQTLVPEVLWALGVVIVFGLVYAYLRRHKRVSDEEAALLAGHATRYATLGMLGFVALALVVATSPVLPDLDGDHRLFALVLVLVAALTAATVGSLTRRFVYLATTTFLLVGVFLSFTAYWREGQANAVRGAAIIRDNQKAVAGLFVAEGSGRVYIARVSLYDEGACKKAGGGVDGCQIIDHRSRLVGISKGEVSDIALGDPKPPWRALEQARHLERELCDLQVQRPAQGC
jgi:hypothetical protein